MPSFQQQPGAGLCSDTSLKPQLRTHTYCKENADFRSRACHPWFLHVHLPMLRTDNLTRWHSWPRVHMGNTQENREVK